MFVSLGQWNTESCLKAYCDAPTGISAPGLRAGGTADHVYGAISNWAVYHFNDTSPLASLRRDWPVRDRLELRGNAENIAAFLLQLREKFQDRYSLLKDTIRLIAPFFDDFVLEPESNGKGETVRLEWHQNGSDFPFQPSQFSDGTLRFICLATALLQPDPPATIVVDEPELGLHPYALSLLANLIESASEHTQIIVSTQSPQLLDHFQPETVVIVRRQAGESVFERLDTAALHEWMEEYSVSELWRKNVFQGGPSHE
ncbi:MAG TPA: AAA family ATPase [Candidatus Hydrogenedentes bacterium]|nr:AAA family ATPase [Candidatus Hydrogenedentota bacterium]